MVLCAVVTELSKHILDLQYCRDNTSRAEDRNLFGKMLAQAAIISALVETQSSKSRLFDEIETYDRIWSFSYPEFWEPSHPDSYKLFKIAVGYPES